MSDFVMMIMGIFLIVFGVCAYNEDHPKVRDYPAYCIDPFASRDMGKRTYTLCKLVPMWSIKV